ncbi:MAG: DUF4982 domain-containing protein [Bacteroidaceae bacterium]|nr:DUF4982 domain-containing protein [Bacteroidaceae bacterium]
MMYRRCLFALALASSVTAFSQRTETLIRNWKFINEDVEGAQNATFNDVKWKNVVVPHDWAINGPFSKEIDIQKVAIEQNGEKESTEKTGRTGALPYIGTGWYRTTFKVDNAYQRTLLVFDGVMSCPEIYLNGKKVGEWKYGYTPFVLDVTSAVDRSGSNTLAVRAENVAMSSRWYPGAGIYRPVRLIQTQDLAVKPWGVTVTSQILSTNNAVVSVKTELNKAEAGVVVENRIIGGDADYLVSSKSFSDGSASAQIEVKNPKLWSPETPNMYKLLTVVKKDGKEIDRVVTPFGIRSISFSAEKGFQLNGVSRKFKGVCLHHDLGPIGAAINKSALIRQIKLLKEMGCDAIRTSHNIPSPWQMEICDSLGMMVMAESFDEWIYPKCKNGYHLYFDNWVEKDLTNLVLCHKNHPSIVMWSIGNEIPEQGSAKGSKIAKRLVDLMHVLDPSRPVTAGCDRVDAAVKNGFIQTLDVPGLNYRTHKYQLAYDACPHGFILGSETASTVSSRGVYKFPVRRGDNLTYPDGQCSSYDLEACSWSNIPEKDYELQDDKNWVVGEFVWTGFDYLGEPTPYDEYWPSRSSYFGILDLAGLPKDRYYLYRSRWNTEKPTLHLLPHWTWNGKENDTIPVYCYTSYPEAELFVNGKSMGRKKKDASVLMNRYRLHWDDVVYKPGSIKVVAYDADGKAVATEEVKTAGKPHHIKLDADTKILKADGEELAFVTASVVDKDGNLCPAATNQLQFSVKGSGRFKAACNGDATSTEVFTQPRMKAFGGQLVVVVQSSEKAGKMSLTVKGAGLKPASETIEVK